MIDFLLGTFHVCMSVSQSVNAKSSGIDDIHAEHIKYAPPSSHENITKSKVGHSSDELHIGILTPLPKPGERKGRNHSGSSRDEQRGQGGDNGDCGQVQGLTEEDEGS